ncbi:TRAP transporter small permease [Pseudotabrizicola alkalilacus]|uniref:TRAP transporter small permease protein n=1 Tax=Pseudotabrizicola alkalilacus TaxID=2305252 RepID=A0A411YWP3_9RHOB|nr:TRAP transporter small permease [Pseudotabrizicola alkalilacus]RGP35153.1 TRAP transporter small permease [Pseudotabrizicola alkalilacus]
MQAPHPVTVVVRAADLVLAALEAFLTLLLAAMIALVFGNVVLRYGFSSGIIVTDEVSRMMFVWLAFAGAVAVSRRHQQLGVDFIIAALPAPIRRIVFLLGNLAILFCCGVLVSGAWGQMQLNWINTAPVSGLPTALTYAAPWLSGIGIGCVAFANAVGAALGWHDGTMASAEEDHGS